MTRYPHRLNSDHLTRLIRRPDPTILEIGCNEGMDTKIFLEVFPDVKLHCFEPDPRPVARFNAAIGDSRCDLTVAAVCDRDGEGTLFLSGGHPEPGTPEWDLSSSICAPRKHLRQHPWCTFSRSVPARLLKLDTWIREHPEVSTIDLIWADVQGAEHLLIAGALAALARTRWFYTEYSDIELYDGQIGSAEIIRRLPLFEPVATYDGHNLLLRNRMLRDDQSAAG